MSVRTRLLMAFAVIALLAAVTTALALSALGGIAAVFGGTAVAVIASWFAARHVARMLTDLGESLHALAQGDVSTRFLATGRGDLAEMSVSVRRIGERLSSREHQLNGEQTFLSVVADSANEALLAIDQRRRVIWINDAGRRILALSDVVPFAADYLPRLKPLSDAIDSALNGQTVEPIEVRVGRHILAMSARPLPSRTAVVLALFDLTHVRRLENMRKDFVANVSHELRTPLTAIRGFSETLLGDGVPDDLRARFVQSIHANAERMARLVDDLLDLSRIESGMWTPQLADVDTLVVARDVCAAMQEQAKAKQLALTVEVALGAEHVSADPTALRQILTNLSENAIRYTPEHGSVIVRAVPARDGIELSVQDTGVGIPASQLSRIFERFYRVDYGRARNDGGTGLGLAIVKHLAEAHGGHVRADSSPGVGTMVTVFLPGRRSE